MRSRKLIPQYETVLYLKRIIYKGTLTIPAIECIVNIIDIPTSDGKEYLIKDKEALMIVTARMRAYISAGKIVGFLCGI